MSDQTLTDNQFTHFDEAGNARMVDVGGKSDTVREATASGAISLSAPAFQLVQERNIAKGDVLGVARIAGIMAAKKVDDLIPLTHPLAINKVTVDFKLIEATHTIEITATVGITGRTGVEMEALTAVSVAALTIYDMCKAVDKGMIINNIRLERKIGGKSGSYQR
ncbi:MAG TPA: cyclic pyranopterin monophosphate synthase MoaC [Desulfobulbaceae bacterium]|nr:MAG: molybdenum cofactor biosynthesis protein C [Deltaproteobacteria bacterium RIFOXYD12_FULL_53_23]HCC54824.1 cyclic pyranopterin monophosphate synthase MoaC [Desulfobulbaceae bacterium]